MKNQTNVYHVRKKGQASKQYNKTGIHFRSNLNPLTGVIFAYLALNRGPYPTK